MRRPPLLWVVIGPNGAGKSTYYDEEVAPRLDAEFINADRIARDHLGTVDVRRSYEAARMATERRVALLQRGQSMVFETVFSHPSKLAFCREARARGYEVWITLLMLDSPDLCVERVRERVSKGGHDVPEVKIRARYDRMQAHARVALREASRGWVVDNSNAAMPLRTVAKLAHGSVVWTHDAAPDWLTTLLDD